MFTGAISEWNLLVLFQIVVFLSILTFKLRKRFSIGVNCWFCNINSRVPYIQRNSWICQHCDQYNGFSADGGYNRDIPAQYCTKLNKSPQSQPKTGQDASYLTPSIRGSPGNGLCESCNRNQELRVKQLASFIPKNERTFDKEVEMFEKHLDKAYALCPDCESVLKRQLNRVKRRILSLLTNTLKIASENITVSVKGEPPPTLMFSISVYTVVILAVLNFLKTSQRLRLSELEFADELPTFWVGCIASAIHYTSATLEILLVISNYLCSQFYGALMAICSTAITPIASIFNPMDAFEGDLNVGHSFTEHFVIQLLGAIISLWVLCDSEPESQKKAIGMCLAWSVSLFDSYLREHSTFTDGLFVVLSLVTLAASCWNLKEKSTSARDIVDTSKTFHRIYSDCSDVEEEEESEELERSAVTARESVKYPMRKFLDTNCSPLMSSPKQKSQQSLNDSFYTINSTFSRNPGENSGSKSRICSPNVFRNGHKFGECSLKPAGSLDNLSLFSETFHSFDNRSHFSDFNSTLCDFKTVQGLPTEEFNTSIGRLRINDSADVTARSSRGNLWQSSIPYRQESNFTMAHAQMSPQSLMTPQNSSWVAGGFWSGSPQKKPLIRSQFLNTATAMEDFQPIESRPSSQSSGFESRPNSVHDNIGMQNNSRESSISGDGEINSAFSEPQRNFNNNTSKGAASAKSSVSLINRPLPVFPVINSSTQAFIHPSMFGKN